MEACEDALDRGISLKKNERPSCYLKLPGIISSDGSSSYGRYIDRFLASKSRSIYELMAALNARLIAGRENERDDTFRGGSFKTGNSRAEAFARRVLIRYKARNAPQDRNR